MFKEVPTGVAVDCTGAPGVGVFQGAPVEMVQAPIVKTRMAIMKQYLKYVGVKCVRMGPIVDRYYIVIYLPHPALQESYLHFGSY